MLTFPLNCVFLLLLFDIFKLYPVSYVLCPVISILSFVSLIVFSIPYSVSCFPYISKILSPIFHIRPIYCVLFSYLSCILYFLCVLYLVSCVPLCPISCVLFPHMPCNILCPFISNMSFTLSPVFDI